MRLGMDFEQECFFIAPIGDADSEIRKRSDGVRDWVVKPAAHVYGLKTLRADDVGEPGQITSQAVQHCLKAKAAVADLTGGNPNVYYELSIRHGAQLPVVLIAQEGTKLPFDISQSRVIFFDHTDLTSAGDAREELQRQIAASLQGPADNPISDGMRLAELKGGNMEERTLAALVEEVRTIGASVERLEKGASGSAHQIPPADTPPFFSLAEREALARLDTVAASEASPMTGAEVAQIAEMMLERTEALEAAKRNASESADPQDEA